MANGFAILSFAALLISFAAVSVMNLESIETMKFKETPAVVFAPPYSFRLGDVISYFNAYFFVLVFSLLLFGFSAPIAMGIEGAKYATLLSTQAMNGYDLLFIIPELMAAYSAAVIGQSVLGDFESNETVFSDWNNAMKFFIGSLLVLIVLIVGRTYFVK